MMTWEQKFVALKALGDCALKMRAPGDWYLSLHGVEVKRGPMLGSVGESGPTPEAAVTATWDAVTTLPPGQYLVMGALRSTRRAVVWGGFMWQEVKEPLGIVRTRP